MTTVPKGTDMRSLVSDALFDEMTKGYPPEVRATKRAGLDFLNSIMYLNAMDAVECLNKMRKTLDGIARNFSLLATAQILSPTPADATRPIGEIMNEILAKNDGSLTPKSKAEHESHNFGTVH